MDSDTAGQCRLLVGPAAWTAQLLLAGLAVAALAYKRWVPCGNVQRRRQLRRFSTQHAGSLGRPRRHVERPQRPVKVWGLDVSKQGVSMLAAHICGGCCRT